MIPADQVARFQRALPFWMSFLLVPVALLGALTGGWTVILLPVVTWYVFTLLDALLGLYTENADPATPEDRLTWYRAITLSWVPVQFALLYWMIWYVTGPGDAHLGALETVVLFFGVGVVTGTV
ncbi:MAG: alkane 1-monooxygenase, partial [Roseovarius sp.]